MKRKVKPLVVSQRNEIPPSPDLGFRFDGWRDEIHQALRNAGKKRWLCACTLHRSALPENQHSILVYTQLGGKKVLEAPSSREEAQEALFGVE